MLPEIVEQYIAGTGKLREAIKGMTREHLLAKPIPGKWSSHVLVIHLVDAELAFFDRVKRLVAMDNPKLEAWHENAFLEKLFYEEQSVEEAVDRFENLRRNLSVILKRLKPDDFKRVGQHNERGPQTIIDVLGYAVWHLDHHLKFLAEKRTALGL